jgi:casein kinase 1
MVMDLLGPSLQDLFESNNNRLDLETTLNIGIQIIKIIKDIHSQGILYRDIKPENFLIGNHRST